MAFTLLELIVVLGILLVLAGIGFPFIQSGVEASRRAQCIANLKGWASVIQGYSADNNQQIHWYPNNNSTDAPWNSKGTQNPYLKYFPAATTAEANRMIGLWRSCPGHRVVVGNDPTEPEVGYAWMLPGSCLVYCVCRSARRR